MLVLSRNVHTKLRIGDDVTLTILGIRGRIVRVGIDAPKSVRIIREELRGVQTAQPQEKDTVLLLT